MGTWGSPTDREVDSVVKELLKHHPETVAAAESIYGSSRNNAEAFKQAIRHAMAEGGIRRTDGQKWGLNETVSGIFVEPPESRTASTNSAEKLKTGGEAVVTGPWNLALYPEPLVKSWVFLSPGAHMKVVEITEVKQGKWTHVILDDGQDGWLEGEPQAALTSQDGRIASFSYTDARVFFTTRHEAKSRVGFMLHWAQVLTDTNATSGGDLKQIILTTADMGDLELPLEMIRTINIDRSRNVPVEVSTRSKTYRGDFRKYHPTIVAKDLLVVTSPFVSVKDFRNEIDLESVEHVVLEATSAPIAAQAGR